MAKVGDVFAIPIDTNAWAAGWVAMASPVPSHGIAFFDGGWDHKPDIADLTGVPLIGRNFPQQPNVTQFSRYTLMGELPYEVIGNRTLENVAVRGTRTLRSCDDLMETLLSQWRPKYDRARWLEEQLVVARNRGLAWRPPKTLSGWRYERPWTELFTKHIDSGQFHLVSKTLNDLCKDLVKVQRKPDAVRDAFRRAISELDVIHRDHLALDAQDGEVLLRRMTQLAYTVGISPQELSQLAAHRTWPAAPMLALHLDVPPPLPTDSWKVRLAATADAYPLAGIEAVEKVLEHAQQQRRELPQKGSRKHILAWIEETTRALNRVDETHGLIDTQEREQLVSWILDMAGMSFSEDPTERWRDW